MDSGPIQIVLPVALKEVFAAISPVYTKETARRFKVALKLNPEVPDHIASGAKWSIALSNPAYIQRIVDRSISAGGLRNLGYAPLSFAVRGETDMPPLDCAQDIAGFLAQTSSIAITETGTSGAQFARLAEMLNMTKELQDRVRPMPGGGPMAALQNGDVDVAALPLTNIVAVPGVEARAICPFDMDVHIDLAFCISQTANGATHHFAKWLLSAEMAATLRALGVSPPPASTP
ncbi:MAG: substrate-binding domain-containing protein [Pseudomonadota bacterium]